MIPKTQAIKLKINGTPSNFRTPWHKKQHSEKATYGMGENISKLYI